MSCAIPPVQFPPWKGAPMADMTNIVLALGQVEEAMGALDDGAPECRQRAVEASVRARNFLLQVIAQQETVGVQPGGLGMISDLPEAIRVHATATLASVAQSIRAAYCWGLAHGKDTGVSEPEERAR